MDKYNKFKEQLDETTQWPSVYMFKMIIPADHRLYALVCACFPPEANVSEKHSSKGNYISITAKELMLSSDEVVDRYKDLAGIEGVILL